jgi:hypothetical protein
MPGDPQRSWGEAILALVAGMGGVHVGSGAALLTRITLPPKSLARQVNRLFPGHFVIEVVRVCAVVAMMPMLKDDAKDAAGQIAFGAIRAGIQAALGNSAHIGV